MVCHDLPGNGVDYGGLGSPLSINEDNPQQTCLPAGQFEQSNPLTERPFLDDSRLGPVDSLVMQGPGGEHKILGKWQNRNSVTPFWDF